MKKVAEKFWPKLDFDPLFWILDKSCKWVMAVKSQDQYSYKGVYVAYQGKNHGWQIWPAYKSRQQMQEYLPSFDFTKEESWALLWAYNNSHLPDTQDVQRERVADFPKY